MKRRWRLDMPVCRNNFTRRVHVFVISSSSFARGSSKKLPKHRIFKCTLVVGASIRFYVTFTYNCCKVVVTDTTVLYLIKTNVILLLVVQSLLCVSGTYRLRWTLTSNSTLFHGILPFTTTASVEFSKKRYDSFHTLENVEYSSSV